MLEEEGRWACGCGGRYSTIKHPRDLRAGKRAIPNGSDSWVVADRYMGDLGNSSGVLTRESHVILFYSPLHKIIATASSCPVISTFTFTNIHVNTH